MYLDLKKSNVILITISQSAECCGYLHRGVGGHGVAAGVHYSLTVSVAGPVADLVVPPAALLLVLDGVHVVQDDGAVLVAPAQQMKV